MITNALETSLCIKLLPSCGSHKQFWKTAGKMRKAEEEEKN